MQATSAQFTTRTTAVMRPIAWAVLMSFPKTYDAGIDYFTIGTSTIGGTDILKNDTSVLQEWDKYNYDDYSDRILSIEINREADPPINPVSLATATITLDNHDDLFTPGNVNSPLNGFILPRRPVRINLGFGNETIPKFVGVTTDKPLVDERSKTATITAVDFLSAIMNIPLDEEVMYINYRTDQIISALLVTAGLDPSQFDLDTGSVIIPFAYFKKGSKIGDGLRDTAMAELGNVRMQENGRVVFQNRQNWNAHSSVWTFDLNNIIERKNGGTSTVINVVEVYSKAREVQAKQSLWQSGGLVRFSDGTTSIGPGETKELFIDFKDDYGDLPVTTMDDPDPISSATTSFYAANSMPDASGADISADVDLVSTDLFSTGAKLTYTNNGAVDGFITQMEIFATPAKVVNDIYQRLQDDASVGTRDGFEERPVKIENDLIQDAIAANTIGQIILEDRGNDDDQQSLIVKSVPQLQIGDSVTYDDDNETDDYFVTRVNDIINSSGYRQVLQVSKRTINTYFRIGISTIGGSDVLGP